MSDETISIECSNCGLKAVKDKDESIPCTNICPMCLAVDSFREVMEVDMVIGMIPDVSQINATVNFEPTDIDSNSTIPLNEIPATTNQWLAHRSQQHDEATGQRTKDHRQWIGESGEG